MATKTFIQTTVDSSNPLARFDESISAEQWSIGADSADSGKLKICNTADLSGTCVVDFDDTTANFGGDVNIAGDLDVTGTISGNINVNLMNPIVDGDITSLSTTEITVEACDLNLAAADGRFLSNVTGAGPFTFTLDNTIAGNTTAAYSVGEFVNVQNVTGLTATSGSTTVFEIATIPDGETFTVSAATGTPAVGTSPYFFRVGTEASVDGCGLFLRARDGSDVDADKTLTYDNAADQWNSSIGLNFTDNTDVVSFADNQVLSNTDLGTTGTNMANVYVESVGRSATNGNLTFANLTTGNTEIYAGIPGLGGGDIILDATQGTTTGEISATGVGALLDGTTAGAVVAGDTVANNATTAVGLNAGTEINAIATTNFNVTAGTDNNLQVSPTQTTFNSTNKDVGFQVRGQTIDDLLYVDPTNIVDTLVSDGTGTGDFQAINQVGGAEYQIVLGTAFPNVTVTVGTLVTVAGTAGGTFDIVDAPVLSVTSQTDFNVQYGSDLGAGPAPPQLGALISSTLAEEAVGIGRVPNDGVSDTPGEFILDVNGKMRATSCDCTSDRTFKSDIVSIESSEALALVKQLRPVRHDWKVAEFPDRKFDKGRQIGFIAQEVKEVVPEVVSGREGGMSVEYGKLVAVLTAAVQDLSQQVSDLKAQLDAKQ